MLSKRIGLLAGLAVALSAGGVSANTMSAFGLQYTSLGSATLSSADGGVEVSGIGTTGGDGVSIALPPAASSASNPIAFSLDTSIDGTIPVGDYLQQTAYGPGAGGTTTALATITETETDASGDVSVSADFTNSSNGQPLTVNYYSGGPGGTLEYTYTGGTGTGTEPSDIIVTSDIGHGGTIYGDFSWSHGFTGGIDTTGAFTSVDTSDGKQLSDIDFIDFVAPTDISPLEYTSMSLTGGGSSDFGSFAITGEALAVPEPGSLALLAIGMIGLIGLGWRRRQR